MSRLDDIVSLNETVPNEEIKRQFKDLMLKLVKETSEDPEIYFGDGQKVIEKRIEEL